MRQNVRYAPQTNIQVPYSNANKDERNRNLITRFFAFRLAPMRSGPKGIAMAQDPFHRPIAQLQQEFRLNASASGKARGIIRPVRAGAVTFRQMNQLQQMTRRPIGPYNQTTQKSMISRISDAVTQGNGG